MSYLLITIAGIGHKDLLLNSDITLPILQVRIELTRFFLFAPILLVLIHVGLIGQLVLLARKTLEFAASIRMLETTDQRTHPLRLELDNFFFVQAIAGPERSRIVGFFLHGMSWLTLVVMPVILLLYMQLVFLPYHDVAITWAHRRRADGRHRAPGLRRRVPVAAGDVLLPRVLAQRACIIPSSLTVNGAAAGRRRRLLAVRRHHPGRGPRRGGAPGQRERAPARSWATRCRASASRPRARCFGLFPRNLIVTDVDLVVDKDVTPGEPSINLRGRDLRFAKLDRTDLHQADMTGANLEGASLVGATCAGRGWAAAISTSCCSPTAAAPPAAPARAAPTSPRPACPRPGWPASICAGRRLEAAQLDGAQLAQALMSGANLANARLDLADLTGAWLHGANLLLASLQGADLAGAKPLMADFTSASLQGANLSLAGLEGAVLRDARARWRQPAHGRACTAPT